MTDDGKTKTSLPSWERNLDRHRNFFFEELNPTDEFLNELMRPKLPNGQFLLTFNEMKKVDAIEERAKRARVLVDDILRYKEPKEQSFQLFCDILRQTGNESIAERLQTSDSAEKECRGQQSSGCKPFESKPQQVARTSDQGAENPNGMPPPPVMPLVDRSLSHNSTPLQQSKRTIQPSQDNAQQPYLGRGPFDDQFASDGVLWQRHPHKAKFATEIASAAKRNIANRFEAEGDLRKKFDDLKGYRDRNSTAETSGAHQSLSSPAEENQSLGSLPSGSPKGLYDQLFRFHNENQQLKKTNTDIRQTLQERNEKLQAKERLIKGLIEQSTDDQKKFEQASFEWSQEKTVMENKIRNLQSEVHEKETSLLQAKVIITDLQAQLEISRQRNSTLQNCPTTEAD